MLDCDDHFVNTSNFFSLSMYSILQPHPSGIGRVGICDHHYLHNNYRTRDPKLWVVTASTSQANLAESSSLLPTSIEMLFMAIAFVQSSSYFNNLIPLVTIIQYDLARIEVLFSAIIFNSSESMGFSLGDWTWHSAFVSHSNSLNTTLILCLAGEQLAWWARPIWLDSLKRVHQSNKIYLWSKNHKSGGFRTRLHKKVACPSWEAACSEFELIIVLMVKYYIISLIIQGIEAPQNVRIPSPDSERRKTVIIILNSTRGCYISYFSTYKCCIYLSNHKKNKLKMHKYCQCMFIGNSSFSSLLWKTMWCLWLV